MKLAIDISQTAHGTGVARFTKGLAQSILTYDNTHTWTFFYSSLRKQIDPELKESIDKSRHKLVMVPFPPTMLELMWNRIHSMSIDMFVGKQDGIITSDWVEPPSHSKKATVIHDLAYIRYPEMVDGRIKKTLKLKLGWVKKETEIIFADSQSTKEDIEKYLKIQKPIHVIYPGVTVRKPTNDQIHLAKKKYDLNKPFVLAVGKIEPRKNIKRLIEAFVKMENPNVELIIVGPPGWEHIDTSAYKQVRFLSTVADDELYALYASCTVFAYPSLWEGFGFPVIEAMRLGAPVLTSNNSSLKEIAGDAAMLCDPESVDDIQNKLSRLLKNSSLRDDYIKKGLKRSSTFTWENYYNRFIEILTKV